MPLQPDQIDFTMHPSGGGSEVSVAQLTQSLSALQEMVYLAAMQTEGRVLNERLRLPADFKNRYDLQCSPPVPGSFSIRGRVVSRANMADLLAPIDCARIAAIVVGFSVAVSNGEVARIRELMPDSRLRNRMISCVTQISPPVGSGHKYALAGVESTANLQDAGIPESVNRLLLPAEEQREFQTITGRLYEIDFVRHKLTLYHAPTKRALVCSYREDVEIMLLENRRDLIQVTGQVIMDENNQPREIVDVDQIWDLDLSPFVIPEIETRSFRLKTRQAISLIPKLTEDEQTIGIIHQPWGLDVFALTRTELLAELRGQLQMLWIEYAKASDEELAEPALLVKRQLLADWEEVLHAQS